MNARMTITAAVATMLASTALYTLVQGGSWFWAGAGAVVVVSLAGAATRWRTLPTVLCLAVTVAADFLYLNVVFAGQQSWGRVVPTEASLRHLGRLASTASHVVSIYLPPVPAVRGILLLTAGGTGLIAALTDLMAVRLRRPALAGLPLLALFCAPLTTAGRPHGVGAALVFSAGMTGYLGLLSADSRARLPLWGRLVQTWQPDQDSDRPNTRALSATGRKIGTAAVAFALFLPLIVPGWRDQSLFPSHGTGTGTGTGGHVTLPNPVVALSQELHEGRPSTVLTYHTSDPNTPPYLQVYVLDQLSTNDWTLAPLDASYTISHFKMPPAQGVGVLTPGATYKEAVQVGDVKSVGDIAFLPMPYPARALQTDGTSWRVDPATLSVVGPGGQLAGERYSVTFKDVAPTPAQLRLASTPPLTLAADESVPWELRGLTTLAERVTRGAHTSFDQALALQEWFSSSGEFRYSLKPAPVTSPLALLNFLKYRRGYCQQYAFAMAVLARLLHIPARVVVGYTQGTQTSRTDTWRVTTADAHAWPELYFQGYGWIYFEPTPTGGPGQAGQASAIPPSYTFSSPPPPTANRHTTSPGQPGNQGSTAPGRPHVGSNHLTHLPGEIAGFGGAPLPKRKAPPAGPIALAVLVLLLAAPRVGRSARRRWRWWRASGERARAHVAWRELNDDLTDLGVAWRRSDSPRALAERLARLPDLSETGKHALERVCLAEERASYAVEAASPATLRHDVAVARRALARTRSLRTRCLAVFFPASILALARLAGHHALDAFGWIEVATTALRQRGQRWRLTGRLLGGGASAPPSAP